MSPTPMDAGQETAARVPRRKRKARTQAPDSVWGRDSYLAFMRRGVRALVRRATDGDLDAQEALVALQAEVQAATVSAGAALHDHGYSWAMIASVTGTTRQAAAERFTIRTEETR
jgi:hypothetical protein